MRQKLSPLIKLYDYPKQVPLLDVSSSENFITSWKKTLTDAELSDACLTDSQSYDFEKMCFTVIKSALNQPSKLEKVRARFHRVFERIEPLFQHHFGPIEMKMHLLIGLCNGAGWVLRMDPMPTLLFGLEKIIELGWTEDEHLESLMLHEWGHVVHFHHRKGDIEPSTDVTKESVMQLYMEGFAEYVEELIRTSSHRQKQEWLNFCSTNIYLIKQTYLDFMRMKKSTQPFFGDWVRVLGQPDLGYYLGLQWIKFMAKDNDLMTIAKLDYPDLEKNLIDFLTQAI